MYISMGLHMINIYYVNKVNIRVPPCMCRWCSAYLCIHLRIFLVNMSMWSYVCSCMYVSAWRHTYYLYIYHCISLMAVIMCPPMCIWLWKCFCIYKGICLHLFLFLLHLFSFVCLIWQSCLACFIVSMKILEFSSKYFVTEDNSEIRFLKLYPEMFLWCVSGGLNTCQCTKVDYSVSVMVWEIPLLGSSHI